MKQILNGLTFCVFTVGLIACASTMNSTGPTDYDSRIQHVAVVCVSPENVLKFSNELCSNFKLQLGQSGVEATTKVISEMDPSTSSGEASITTDQRADLVMTIEHVRVFLYNGKPSNTLLAIKLLDPTTDKNVWASRVYTKGSNVTGPGNPEKVAAEVIAKMKSDGLKI